MYVVNTIVNAIDVVVVVYYVDYFRKV